jgi:hypothetical protein
MLRFQLFGECQSASPMAGKQRFDSVTQHNQLPSFAWIYSPKPPPLFPALNVMFRHDIAKSSGYPIKPGFYVALAQSG